MKKQAFVLTLGVVLLSVMVAMGMLIRAQANKASSGGGGGSANGAGSANGDAIGKGTSDANGGVVPVQGEQTQAGDYRLSGPYTHKNLAIFLVHGENTIKTKSFLTLQEALVQKKVVVYETKSVNELSIQNFSDEDVYVQSGDIVKGGQQDRMIGVDFIVPPRSGKLPISAFCVEHGRWSGRGNEQATQFNSSADAVATKDIKLAAKRSNSQGAVWENVKVAQDKLSENVGTRVNSTASASSLQLALENGKVQENADSYIKALSGIANRSDDVIGYVFAINGKVNSADIYGSNALFKKLWPKLLKANAIEAIAELQQDKFKPASAESVQGFLSEAEKAKGSDKDVNARVNLLTREDEENILFETRDRAQKGAWVHRNYIKKN
jgi:hypothetical protein